MAKLKEVVKKVITKEAKVETKLTSQEKVKSILLEALKELDNAFYAQALEHRKVIKSVVGEL